MPKHTSIYFLLFSLYWAQGLPVGFMTQALPVILRTEGLSLSQIGGFGLLMLPWSIKVLWAPWVDRHGSTRFGHYRSWIVMTQLCSVAVLIALSFVPIETLNQPLYLFMLFILLFSMNTCGATQDIATDGLAVNILKSTQMGWGNTLQVLGSRLGFIVGGGAMLWALEWLHWQSTFLLLAVLVFLNTLPILRYKEIQHMHLAQQKLHGLSLWQHIQQYLAYFTGTPILVAWLWVLLSFKLADGLSGPILKPLMVDIGLSYQQIGVYVTMLGAVAALFGALLAGYLVQRCDRAFALMGFAGLKVIALSAFSVLAWLFETGQTIHPWWVYAVNAFEDMVSSMLLVVMLTLVMQYSRKAFAGTDFTFQVAIMATISGMLYMFSGVFGDWLGYSTYLMVISALSLLSIVPIYRWMKIKKL